MNRKILAAALAAACSFVSSPVWAHAICGNRLFPATLTIDDPGVADELSLPTIQYAPIPSGAGGGQTVTYGYEWDKTITENFQFSISSDYFTQSSGGTNLSGWDNVDVGLKYEALCDEASEFMVSVGADRTFAKTGSSSLLNAGAIDTTSSTAPTLYFGKGFGDLPIGWARAFAVTGEASYQFSDSPNADPNVWNYAASLQYSIPYLQQHVKDLGLPGFVANLTPTVEFAYGTVANGPTRGQTTGTIAPALYYDADTWQVAVAAVFPGNALTRQSQGTGFVAQFHLFLDDIKAAGPLGKPIF